MFGLALVIGLGCTNEAADIADVAGPSWHADVQPIVAQSCTGCHNQGIAPFPLETYDEVAPLATQVADAAASGRMPPWHAADGCNTYVDDPSLSEADIDTLTQWAEADAPLGDVADSLTVEETIEEEGLPRVDLTLQMNSAFTPTLTPDEYRCFVLEWPLDEPKFVTGYEIIPGNPEMVHHVIAYLAGPEYASALDAADGADGSPGYSCFGGPGVIDQRDADWLGAWVPGAVSRPMPEGLGIYIEPGTRIIFQMHYYDTMNSGSDQSSIELMVEDEVAKTAWIQPIADPYWLEGGQMTIPADTTGVSHDVSLALPINLTVYTASLHMHLSGQSAALSVLSDDGDRCLLEIDDWDFNWQRTYRLEEPVNITAGDQFHLECTWDNTSGQDLDWGDGTDDEMCLGTALIAIQ